MTTLDLTSDDGLRTAAAIAEQPSAERLEAIAETIRWFRDASQTQ